MNAPPIAGTGVIVRPVDSAGDAATFLDLPRRLGWSVPLRFEEALVFNPRRNGVLREWEVARFIAWRGDRPVGRITAARPLLPDVAPIGTFGFLALEQDAAVLEALLAAAAAWLSARGITRWRGPLSVSINHEVGALVAGFGRPGSLRTPITPPWLPAMLDATGLVREMVVHAHLLRVAEEKHRARAARLGMPGLAIRRFDRRRFAAEAALVTDLYNDGWAANWGATRVGPLEAATIGRLMRPALLTGEVFFAEFQGRPVGLCAILPDLTAATVACQGRMLPFGWARMARALLPGGTARARIPLLGTIGAVRGSPVSARAVAGLLSAAIGLADRRGWAEVEISWVLDSNRAMRLAMERLPAPVDRSWAIWGSTIG
ncbi:hypothetical protein ACQW02_26890 [Humitalea sp. 24SJ18S-53]|uniref:hypothetical protein n=1 Tax=Humitalea sp. 24SJ18S-53 TaxID=3422307 RepID=UPI003D66BF5B